MPVPQQGHRFRVPHAIQPKRCVVVVQVRCVYCNDRSITPGIFLGREAKGDQPCCPVFEHAAPMCMQTVKGEAVKDMISC
mmetsp:Transcript_2915/g.8130  ORF Transcript_2915/g.8130 Transcript_2915/m.8130 type:complete len:80 (-) Transcript_2915:625-864(-)